MRRILILGASGMLGNSTLRLFAASKGFEVFGTVRSERAAQLLPAALLDRLIVGIDVLDPDDCAGALSETRPDLVINCVGLVKQLAKVNDPLEAIPINSLLPHKLARLCSAAGARFVHMSTDCVFSGDKGMYTEDDTPDASDLYGRSKLLGEVDYPNAVTLRTSIIGHELDGHQSLVEWFLNQQGEAQGYTKAIFSGLPTVEIARAIRDYVIPRGDLRGVWHVSADPIDKYSLLKLVAERYKKTITLHADDRLRIDRSLDSTRFRQLTGFKPKPWPKLVEIMRDFG